MNTQICFKCGTEKLLTEFYEHPAMANGHLGKCKECAKRDVKAYKHTDSGMAMEKRRNAKPKRKEQFKQTTKRWRKENPEKVSAHNKVNRAVRTGKLQRAAKCESCGNEDRLQGHHEDYSKPLDVNWLCARCHGKHNPLVKRTR